MTTKLLRVADIYCGAGGLSSGFGKAKIVLAGETSAGFDIAYGLDKDPYAIASFNAYHKQSRTSKEEIGQCISVADAQQESWLLRPNHPKIDVLIGGPNCQGVSAAGLRNPKDKRNEMFRYFRDLVATLKPDWFVIENVPGLVHANNRKLLLTIMNALAEPGYQVAADILLAAHYKVPQFRYRLFLIGTKTGKPIRFPDPYVVGIQQFRTVRHGIVDLNEIDPCDNCDELCHGFYNHCVVDVGSVNRERIKSIKPGDDWREMPIHLLPARFFATRASDQKGTYGRLAWDWPAYTITSATSNITAGPFTHPEHNRPLTVREAARLQCFDDDHRFFGPIAAQYRQIGNAVPPLLAKAVAQTILQCHFFDPIRLDGTHEGAITLEILRDAVKNKKTFHIMTPRFIYPKTTWEHKSLKYRKKPEPKPKSPKVGWDPKKRPTTPFEKDLPVLKRRAEQSGNLREAVRARAILAYLEKKSRDQILRETTKSAYSVKKWVKEFYIGGIDGWRAYHSPIADQFQDQPEKQRLIEKSIRLVRKPSPDDVAGEGKRERMHMNDYLKLLIQYFKPKSTRDLILAIEKKEDRGIGTVYVQDLLAVAAICLTDEFHDYLAKNGE